MGRPGWMASWAEAQRGGGGGVGSFPFFVCSAFFLLFLFFSVLANCLGTK